MKNRIKKKESVVYLFFLHLIWPFAAFYFALKNFGSFYFRIFILLFFVLIGFTFIPRPGADSNAYLFYMEFYSNINLSEFLAQVKAALIGQGIRGFEIYQDTISFLVTRFTINHAYVFAFTAIVFYFFWQKIVLSLYREYCSNENQKSFLSLFFLIAFAIYITIFRAINARFYLGYWVFVFAAYKILNDKDYRFLIISALAIFIHQAFIFANLILFIFIPTHFFKSVRNYVFFVLIIAGHLFAEFGPVFVSENLDLFGGDIEQRFKEYTDIDRIERTGERQFSWFLQFRGPFLFYSLVATVFILRFNKRIRFNTQTAELYSFFLLFWAANAFTYNVYHLGSRFRNVLIGFLLLLLFKIFSTNYHKKIPNYAWITMGAFAFFKFITLRMNFEQVSAWVIAPFPLLFTYLEQDLTLWQLLMILLGRG